MNILELKPMAIRIQRLALVCLIISFIGMTTWIALSKNVHFDENYVGFVIFIICGISWATYPWKKKTPKEVEKVEPESETIQKVNDVDNTPSIRTAKGIKEYKEACRNLVQESSRDFTFPCKTMDLVSIVVSIMFENSNKLVKIYAKDMYGELFNNPAFFEVFKKYVDSGKPLQILLDSIVPENAESKSLCLWYLQKNHAGNPQIVIRGTSEEFKKEMSAHIKQSEDKDKPSYYIQMIIGDSRMFKLDGMIEGELHGFCNFQGAKKKYRFFEEIFDSHFTKCVPIPLN